MWGDIGITKEEKKKPCDYNHTADGYTGIHYTILFLYMFDIFTIKMIDPVGITWNNICTLLGAYLIPN